MGKMEANLKKKTCSRCKQEKIETLAFIPRRAACKECVSSYMRKYRSKLPKGTSKGEFYFGYNRRKDIRDEILRV